MKGRIAVSTVSHFPAHLRPFRQSARTHPPQQQEPSHHSLPTKEKPRKQSRKHKRTIKKATSPSYKRKKLTKEPRTPKKPQNSVAVPTPSAIKHPQPAPDRRRASAACDKRRDPAPPPSALTPLTAGICLPSCHPAILPTFANTPPSQTEQAATQASRIAPTDGDMRTAGASSPRKTAAASLFFCHSFSLPSPSSQPKANIYQTAGIFDGDIWAAGASEPRAGVALPLFFCLSFSLSGSPPSQDACICRDRRPAGGGAARPSSLAAFPAPPADSPRRRSSRRATARASAAPNAGAKPADRCFAGDIWAAGACRPPEGGAGFMPAGRSGDNINMHRPEADSPTGNSCPYRRPFCL